MEAQPIFSTRDFTQAEAACAELRSHDIKCGSVETARSGVFAPPYIGLPAGEGHTGQWNVIVAPEDVERATAVLHAWAATDVR
jgi:hypothetical protein